ncbi:MAG: hypothetical protein OXG35_06085 [Acidobacteria bacterium]|nr:hypothetical protein [Acidobacteriota bacterium]
MGGKPTLNRKGYAVRDAEVRISRRGTKYVLVKVRLAVEAPARFVDVIVTGRRDPLDRERAAGVGKGDVVAFVGELRQEREAWSCYADTFTSSLERPTPITPDPAGAGGEPRPTGGNEEPVTVTATRLDDGTWGVRLPKGVEGAAGMPCRKVLRSGDVFAVTLDRREQDSPYGEVWTTGGGRKPTPITPDLAGGPEPLSDDDIPF